jgi:inhibitor of KinA
MEELDIKPYGKNAILITHPIIDSELICFNFHIMHHALLELYPDKILYCVPAYNSLLIVFKDAINKYSYWKNELLNIFPNKQTILYGDLHHIPICYEEPFAIDIYEVSSTCNITTQEIIDIHTSRIYTVFMLGFLPGFAYLGNIDKRLYVNRKSSPRKSIEKNAVGIAGNQTAIYPRSSPGGWNIIGRSMIDVWRENDERPFLMKPFDRVQFYAVSSNYQLL